MEQSQAVRTASTGQSCHHCGASLPPRPTANKGHRFCNATCRSAWHRGAKQRSLNSALAYLVEAREKFEGGRWTGEAFALLSRALDEVRAAGAEPPA